MRILFFFFSSFFFNMYLIFIFIFSSFSVVCIEKVVVSVAHHLSLTCILNLIFKNTVISIIFFFYFFLLLQIFISFLVSMISLLLERYMYECECVKFLLAGNLLYLAPSIFFLWKYVARNGRGPRERNQRMKYQVSSCV